MEINKSTPIVSYRENLINNVKAEAIKVRDTPVAKALFIMIILLTILMCVAIDLFQFETMTSWSDSLNGVFSPAITLLALPFVLLVCEEWSDGTALISYTFTPNRSKVILSKLIVLISTFLLVAAVLVLITYGNAVIYSSFFSHSVNLSFDLSKVISIMMRLLVNMLLGFSMALISQDKTVAMGLYFMIPPVTIILAQIPAISHYAKWFSLGHSSSIFIAGVIEYTTAQYIFSLIVWIIIPSIIGGILNEKKDIN